MRIKRSPKNHNRNKNSNKFSTIEMHRETNIRNMIRSVAHPSFGVRHDASCYTILTSEIHGGGHANPEDVCSTG